MGAFFQDDWQIHRNLTVNLGLRWDVETPFTEKNNRWVGNTYHLPDRSGAYFDWSNDLITQAVWKRFGQDSGA